MPKNSTGAHLLTGKKGEELAADFLLKEGYTIVGINVRRGKTEIDLIAEDEKFLVFVEVKTRKNNHFGPPESFVNKFKQNMISKGAEMYLEQFPTAKMVRFDVVSVTIHPQLDIRHFVDAFC